MKWLEKWSIDIGDRDVLELGCGSGDDTSQIAQYAKSVICGDLKIPKVSESDGRFVQFDHSKPLPFSCTFDVVVASLCLHYFTWERTKDIVSEISRVLTPHGLLICRLNSDKDENYGAKGYPIIEPGLYDVEGKAKRFFSESEIRQLLSNRWKVLSMEHKAIDRYKQAKWVWEICASYA